MGAQDRFIGFNHCTPLFAFLFDMFQLRARPLLRTFRSTRRGVTTLAPVSFVATQMPKVLPNVRRSWASPHTILSRRTSHGVVFLHSSMLTSRTASRVLCE